MRRTRLEWKAEHAPKKDDVTLETEKQKPFIKGETTKRNDSCTCGSGKKYKNCCMNEVQPPKYKPNLVPVLIPKFTEPPKYISPPEPVEITVVNHD